jgi:hypothetical protein
MGESTAAANLVIDTEVFKASTPEEWGFGERKTLRGFAHAVPKTWIRPMSGQSKTVLAMICCPSCRRVQIVDSRVHKFSQKGQILITDNSEPEHAHAFICMCGYVRRVFLDRWLKKPLYACAIERFASDGKIVPEIVYVNANSPQEAKIQCGAGNYRFVEVGLAIGFFTADKNGKDESKLIGDLRSVNLLKS